MAQRAGRLLVAALLVLLAGCGGEEEDEVPRGVAPRAWAQQVCTALASWQEEIAAVSGPLPEPRTTDLAAARTALIGFLDQVTARTDALLERVSTAGTPAVEDGDKLTRDLERAIRELREEFARSRERAASLPADHPRAFREGTARIGADLRNARQRLRNRLDQVEEDYDSPELTEALEKERACARVYAG